MNRILFLFFLYTPDKLLHVCLSIAAYFRSILRVILHYRLDVERYTGIYNGKPVTVGWIGTGEMKDYILKTFYVEKEQVTKLPTAKLLNVKKTIAEMTNSCDIIYVEQFSILPPLKKFKRIKPDLNTLMAVNDLHNIGSIHSTQKRRRRDRETQKLIEKSGIVYKEYEIARHPEKLRLFYDQLYAPHISANYGGSRVEPFKWMQIFYAKGFLRLAYDNGKVISGSLFLKNNNTLTWCKYGVSDSSNKLHRASSSIHMHLQYAKEKRLQYFSAFHTKPFLNDGGFRYKRECGLGVIRESRNYYCDRDVYIKVTNYRSGVADFLQENPFIFEKNGKLVASLLCTEESKDLPSKIIEQYTRYRTAGIHQYQIHIKRELTPAEKETISKQCGLAGDNNRLTFLTYNLK